MNAADLKTLFPEFEWILNNQLREKCIRTWMTAINQGKWNVDTLCKLPFVLKELKD